MYKTQLFKDNLTLKATVKGVSLYIFVFPYFIDFMYNRRSLKYQWIDLIIYFFPSKSIK